MLKPVKSVIASARILIRRPSEQKLATEDFRLLLHQTLDELNQLILKENQDYFTHELEVALTYDATLRGYTLEIDTERIQLQTSGMEPVFFLCQKTTEDQQTDAWQKIRVAKLATFTDVNAAVPPAQVTYIGNNWQGFSGANFKFNLPDDFIAEQRWRLAFRYFPQEVLDLDEVVPFPAEYTSLLEHYLAYKALPLVRDDAPAWLNFASARKGELMLTVEQMKSSLRTWLNKDIDNDYVIAQPYHYRTNNPLHGGRKRIKAQW
jgi:hypothetical protein